MKSGLSALDSQLPAAPLRYGGAKPQATGDRMVFRVPSERSARVAYRVDALGNGGRMACQCADFATRRQPALDRGEPAFTQATLCKHCVKVVFAFAEDLFAAMAQGECEPAHKAKTDLNRR